MLFHCGSAKVPLLKTKFLDFSRPPNYSSFFRFESSRPKSSGRLRSIAMSFWDKKVKDMRPMSGLKYLTPEGAVKGIQGAMNAAVHRAARVPVAHTIFPAMLGIGAIGVGVEWILCASTTNRNLQQT
eukprot:51473-Amorphochlora_amoeboformis.AAC.1